MRLAIMRRRWIAQSSTRLHDGASFLPSCAAALLISLLHAIYHTSVQDSFKIKILESFISQTVNSIDEPLSLLASSW
jgi:hypothetical protein